MPVTYSSYLKLDELLSLQKPLSDGPEHDEMLFVIVHQVYELWFKCLLHEFDRLRELLGLGEISRAQHGLKRILTILKVLVQQIDILETMTPLEFLSFRDRLESGSGFQSRQFRELEFVMGGKRRPAVDHYPAGGADRKQLEVRYSQPSVWDAFLHYLARNGYDVPRAMLERDVTQPITASPELQKTLIRIYRDKSSAVAELCERLVDLDEGFMEWRYRHVRMVQRTIGTKRGTGGSSGAEYLATTLDKPAFPDLWAIRTEL
jgi:tryptophan 2,3-dioxygenase